MSMQRAAAAGGLRVPEMPEDARKCPTLPDTTRIGANQATAPQAALDVPENARTCPGMAANTQNEPKQRVRTPVLTPRQLAAINLMLAGASFADVCRQMRIDP